MNTAALIGCLATLASTGCVASDSGDPAQDDLTARLEEAASMPASAVAAPPSDAPWKLESASAACGGLPTEGIQSFDGLAGYYNRLLPYAGGELVTLQVLTVEQIEGWIGVEGDYYAIVLRDGVMSFEGGRYVAVPNNPAIGPAIAFDTDGDDELDDTYFIAGARRNLFGKLATLCLGKARADGSGSWFLMSRLGL